MKLLSLARFIVVMFFTALSISAQAEVEKKELTCDNKPCVKYWPKVVTPSGWQHLPDESKEQGVNVFARIDMQSDMRMYAYAIKKSDKPELKTLNDVIAHEKEHYREGKAMEGKKLSTYDGRLLPTFLYATKGEARWDQGTYGEDGPYYIVFAITTNGLWELNKYVYDYHAFVASYRSEAKADSKQPAKPKAKH